GRPSLTARTGLRADRTLARRHQRAQLLLLLARADRAVLQKAIVATEGGQRALRSSYGGATLAVSLRLRPVAAYLHRAPRPGVVLRVVIERPLARVPATGLETIPRAARDRAVDDREHPSERC